MSFKLGFYTLVRMDGFGPKMRPVGNLSGLCLGCYPLGTFQVGSMRA